MLIPFQIREYLLGMVGGENELPLICREKVVHFAALLASKGGSARLDSRIMYRLYDTRGFGPMREALVAAGLLNVSRRYIPGSVCKTYSFPFPVTQDTLVEYPICWRPRKVAKRRARERRIAELSVEQRWVFECVQRLQTVWNWQSLDIDNGARRALQKIDRRDWHVKADKAGRLHHNLTNCPREVRGLVRLDGEKLVGVDFSALHPHLILSLYPPNHHERVKLVEWLAGDFYARLDSACATNDRRRKSVKRQFNAAVNDTLSKEWQHTVFARFAQEFAYGAGIVRGLKRRDHRDAAAKLQRLEADLIFKAAVVQCIAERIEVISVHDALYAKPGDAARVRAIMVEAARGQLGIGIDAKIAA